MILGLNTDVRHAGKTFHIQTEDSGPGNPVLVTHLFIGGTIIATKKQSYADLVPDDGRIDESAVRDRMREQHRGMFTELNAGVHDEAARAPTAPKARFKDIPLARKRREPSVSQPSTPAVRMEGPAPAVRSEGPAPAVRSEGPGPAVPASTPPVRGPLAMPPPPLTLTDPVPEGLDVFDGPEGGDVLASAPPGAGPVPGDGPPRGFTEVPLAVPPPLGVTVESPTVGALVRARPAPPPGFGLLGPPSPMPPATSQAPSGAPRAAPRALPPVLGGDEVSTEGRVRPGPLAAPLAPSFAPPLAPPPLPSGVFDEGSVLDLSDEVDEVSVIDDGGLGEPPARGAAAPLRFPTPMSMGRPLDSLLVAFLLDERD